jgi:predicted phosphodiesterase
MRLAVLSDVHANREALLAVQDKLDELKPDSVCYLGDAVGYNPDPAYCLERIAAMAVVVVRGNHDKAVSSLENLDWFNDVAREALLWTRQALSPAALERLGAWPRGPLVYEGRLLLCHGSPMDEDLYISRPGDVQRSLRYLRERHRGVEVCLFGHTHVPVIIPEGGRPLRPGKRFQLERGRAYLINPGSVGQPRDGIPEASFGLFDDEEMAYYHFRVPFAIQTVQRKIRAAGLPGVLADRLAQGW